MGLDGTYWLGISLLEAVRKFNDQNFFRIRRFNSYHIWIERWENTRGVFVKISLNETNSRVKSIIIPSGINYEGWKLVADMVLSIFPQTWESEVEKKFKFEGDRKGQIDEWGRKRIDCFNGIVEKGKVKRVVSYTESVVYREWNRAVVCTKENGFEEWSSIQDSLSNYLGFDIEMKPFQDDRAVFFCKDIMEANRVGKLGRCILKSMSVFLQKWNSNINCFKERFAFNGGWIAIEGLPFHLWKRESFVKIAKYSGGLVEVDKKTEQLQVLTEARITVGRNDHSFILAAIEIKEGDKKIEIKLRPLSRMPWDNSRKFHCRCKVEDDESAKEKTRGRKWGKSVIVIQIGAKFKNHAKDEWRAKKDVRGEINEMVADRSDDSQEEEKK